MITKILFEVPAAYEAGLHAGSLIRVGALLKDAASGQIVAHLQETGVAHAVLSKVLGTAAPSLSVAGLGNPLLTAVNTLSGVTSAASGIYTAVEVTKIKSMLASLQTLQYVTLGVSLVGLGATLAGFFYMRKRFNALNGRIDELMQTIQAGFAEQRATNLRAHISQINGLMKEAKQASTLSNPERGYGRVADAMSEHAAHFEGELEFIIKTNEKINAEMFWQLAQLMILSNSVRIDCRIRTNELRNAREIAESVAEDYRRLFDPLSVISLQASESDADTIIKTLRETTDAALTKPYLIEYLRTHRIDGKEYLDRLEKETTNPFLMLKTA